MWWKHKAQGIRRQDIKNEIQIDWLHQQRETIKGYSSLQCSNHA